MKDNTIQVIAQTEAYGYGFNEIDNDGEGLLLRNFLKPGQVVFDVGANTGDWSSYALAVEPSLDLFCFEPVPVIYKQLVEKMNSKKAKLHNFALSNKSGKEKFFSTENFNLGLGSFFNRPDFRSQEIQITVDMNTLDSFCATQSIDRIDFLKIDVEGSELAVLQGAQNMLANRKIAGIQFEYGGTFPDAGITLKEVMKLLVKHDFVLFRLFSFGLIHISEWKDNLENHTYCNYFAVLNSAVPQFSKISGL